MRKSILAVTVTFTLGVGPMAAQEQPRVPQHDAIGVFVVDNELTRIEATLDIFPTCRWADCIVSFEKVSWPSSEIVVAGSGSYGDGPFRKTYSINASMRKDR